MPAIRGVNLNRELASHPPKGISAVHARLRLEALALVEAENLVQASYSYRIVRLEEPAGETLRVGGETLHAPRLLPESGELTALGCAACTLGPRLEARVTALFGNRRAALAVVLDQVGNEILSVLGRRLQDRMLSDCRRRRLTMAGELRAGDPGLDISAQAAVLRLAGAANIGVCTHDAQLLYPLKSGSMIVGVGKDLPLVSWSRCDTCPSNHRCAFGCRQ